MSGIVFAFSALLLLAVVAGLTGCAVPVKLPVARIHYLDGATGEWYATVKTPVDLARVSNPAGSN